MILGSWLMGNYRFPDANPQPKDPIAFYNQETNLYLKVWRKGMVRACGKPDILVCRRTNDMAKRERTGSGQLGGGGQFYIGYKCSLGTAILYGEEENWGYNYVWGSTDDLVLAKSWLERSLENNEELEMLYGEPITISG